MLPKFDTLLSSEQASFTPYAPWPTVTCCASSFTSNSSSTTMKFTRTCQLLALASVTLSLRPQEIRSPNTATAYAPSTNVPCPDLSTAPLIRRFTPQNQTLHPEEEQYINTRAKTILPAAWKDWIGDGSRLGYNLSTYSGPFPKVGVAIPGGGLRAALYGASCLHGLDARNKTAKDAGTGGLLQVASYMTGLSGSLNNCL